MENNKIQFSFAQIEDGIEIPQLVEDINASKSYVQYGSDNQYPEYLYTLYAEVSSLKTIIEGTADYVAGDDAICNAKGFTDEVNRQHMTARELVTLLARDYLIYGGYSVQVVNNGLGEPTELYYLDFRYCRTSKDNQSIYYNPEFSKKWGRSAKTVTYPKYLVGTNQKTGVLYVKNTVSSTYPVPRYSGAIKSCEIERRIDQLHLNSLKNGFMGSYIINLNGGVPNDEQKKEIEKKLKNKFGGTESAGNIMVTFNASKDNMATVQRLDITDFSEKYKAAAERSREQIFASFRANPQLFGIVSQATGFSRIEYQEAYELYYYTVVKPIQRLITDNFDKVFNMKGSFTITPFSFGEIEANNVS